ncbi:hypothetical protein [Streptomyces barkulensis]|uniref:hypothetical protein n=1 Tax=Streptomyces barkulensis TaxID=1257026 RepID=UPI000C6E5562|nr:hypothetical protein [Streptomyces barkulensis]
MTNTPHPRRADRWQRNGLVRLITHSDPIALVGICLSIALDVNEVASGVESLLVGLLVTVLSLVLDASARAERRFQLRRVIGAADWIAESVTSTATTLRWIHERYPGTAVEDETRRRLRRLAEELEQLGQGRVERPRDDSEHLLAATRECRERMEAVTNIVGEPVWWRSDLGVAYWQANLDALDRGVRIRRVFLVDRHTAELEELLEYQRRAGVEVVVKYQEGQTGQLINYVVWDGLRAWEARMDARGEIMAQLFTLNGHDVERLRDSFRRLVPTGS